MATRADRRRKSLLLGALLALALGLTACGPEAARERGEGDGADVGNHGDPIVLHGDDSPFDSIYYQTPHEDLTSE